MFISPCLPRPSLFASPVCSPLTVCLTPFCQPHPGWTGSSVGRACVSRSEGRGFDFHRRQISFSLFSVSLSCWLALTSWVCVIECSLYSWSPHRLDSGSLDHATYVCSGVNVTQHDTIVKPLEPVFGLSAVQISNFTLLLLYPLNVCSPHPTVSPLIVYFTPVYLTCPCLPQSPCLKHPSLSSSFPTPVWLTLLCLPHMFVHICRSHSLSTSPHPVCLIPPC